MATTEKKGLAPDMTSGESYARACHKTLWDYFGWVERLLPPSAVGLRKALYVLQHPGTTRHERARAAADAIAAIVAVRALLDIKPRADPTAATLRDFDPTACACIRQLAQELIEYAVPAMLPPVEQEAADLRLALLLSADMPPYHSAPSDERGFGPPNADSLPPALSKTDFVGHSHDSLLSAGQSRPIAAQNCSIAGASAPQGGGARHWLAALASDLLDEHGDREESFSQDEEADDAAPIRSDGKKEV